jgi:ribosomal protein L1
VILTEKTMNEDVFNMSLRKFLKKVGVTSQREIEKAVRDAIESGKLKGDETLPAEVTIRIGGVELTEKIDGKIELT